MKILRIKNILHVQQKGVVSCAGNTVIRLRCYQSIPGQIFIWIRDFFQELSQPLNSGTVLH